jgi:F-type H+-transporting ATPase subunit b
MPQLNQLMLAYASQWFWLLLVLAVIYFVIGRGMVPKIEATVDARNRQIADDLAAAQRARAVADEAETALQTRLTAMRGDAQSITAAAKVKSASETEKRLGTADAEIAVRLAAAEESLATARKSALDSIEQVAAEAAQDIVGKITGMSVSAKDAAGAVKAVLAHG